MPPTVGYPPAKEGVEDDEGFFTCAVSVQHKVAALSVYFRSFGPPSPTSKIQKSTFCVSYFTPKFSICGNTVLEESFSFQISDVSSVMIMQVIWNNSVLYLGDGISSDLICLSVLLKRAQVDINLLLSTERKVGVDDIYLIRKV